MRVIQIQNDFTAGELDPKLRARTDIDQYGSGLDIAKNVVIQPQGGAQRRPGTLAKNYFDTGTFDPDSGARFIPFEFSVNDHYMIVVMTSSVWFYRNGSLITDINGSGLNYLSGGIPGVSSINLHQINWVQSADTLIIVHENMQPVKVVRGASHSSWTVSALSFDYIPKYAFSTTVYPGTGFTASDHLEPSGTSGNITVEAHATGGHSPAAIFNSAPSFYEGQYINVTPFGRLRIVKKLSSSKLQVYAEVPLFDTSDIPSANWELETGHEDTWSATRGWPRSVVFHEGRLFFGGSRSRPSTIWGSRVGDFFNFDPGEFLDDASVEATLDTGSFNAITDMASSRHLQIFTTGAEFYVPQTLDEPITPTTLIVKEQTRYGSKEGIRVQNVDGGTLFIQRQGKALQEFIYSDTVSAYTSAKISLLSSHLLDSPTDMAVRKSTSTDEGDRLMIVNSGDGSIACYTLLRSQNIVAASKWVTDGEYMSIGVDLEYVYTFVHRVEDGVDVYYIELFDNTVLLDCANVGGAVPGGTVGFNRLDGKTLKIIRDGIVEPDQVSAASITFEEPPTESYQIGLDIDVQVKTLPVEPKLASGSLKAFKKRIFEVNAQLFETQNIAIGGTEIPFRLLDGAILDAPVEEYTGIKTLHGILGYTYEGQINFTQTQPLKMTLLGVDFKLSAGQ